MFAKSAVIVAPPEGGQRGLSRVVLRDGLGIGILTRGWRCQLLDDAGAYLPTAALHGRLLLALADLSVVLGAAQLALNLDVVALLQVLCVVGGLAERDDAVPLGVVHPLFGLLALVAGLGGQREDGEGLLLFGGEVLGFLAEVALQSDFVFVECHCVSPCLYLPGLPSGHSCAKRREVPRSQVL